MDNGYYAAMIGGKPFLCSTKHNHTFQMKSLAEAWLLSVTLNDAFERIRKTK